MGTSIAFKIPYFCIVGPFPGNENRMNGTGFKKRMPTVLSIPFPFCPVSNGTLLLFTFPYVPLMIPLPFRTHSVLRH